MKAWVIKKGSEGLDDVTQVERPDPKPGTGEILVRIKATSLNYRDQAVVTGNYFGGKATEDTIPLSDGAGEVVAVGNGVTRFKEGDRAVGTFFKGWIDGPPRPGEILALGQSGVDGVLAEYVVFNEQDAVQVPASLSLEEAACLPCAGVTAWHGLVVSGDVKPGDTVLTLGTGGVSTFALQFAKAAGARVIATSSSDEKLQKAKSLGADDLINYKKTPEWEKEVLKLTNGKGVDHIIEVGGVGTLARSFQSVGVGGNIALIGVLAGFEGDTNPHGLMLKGAKLEGIFVGNRAMFEAMNAAIEINGIKPVVDKVFPFDEAKEAYRYELAGKHYGKVVIGV